MRNVLVKSLAALCLMAAGVTPAAAQEQNVPPTPPPTQQQPAPTAPPPSQASPPQPSTTPDEAAPPPADGPGFSDATATEARRGAPSVAVQTRAEESGRVGVVAIFNRTERPLSEGVLRERLVNFLDEGGIDAISIESVAPDEVAAEARSKQCAFILYTEIVALKQSTASKLSVIFGSQSSGKNDARIEMKLVAAKDMSQVHQANVDFKEEGGEEAGSVTTALESGAKEVASEAVKKK